MAIRHIKALIVSRGLCGFIVKRVIVILGSLCYLIRQMSWWEIIILRRIR